MRERKSNRPEKTTGFLVPVIFVNKHFAIKIFVNEKLSLITHFALRGQAWWRGYIFLSYFEKLLTKSSPECSDRRSRMSSQLPEHGTVYGKTDG